MAMPFSGSLRTVSAIKSPNGHNFARKEEFSQDEYDMQMGCLMKLRQTGTVSEYRHAFDSAMYHLMTLGSGLNIKYFVTQFVLGLRDDICTAVCI
jgi:hypothetical protein